jgi:hypothetical protein
MEIAENCLEILYDLHTSNYKGESKLQKLYTSVTDDIINDMLMNKYDKYGKFRQLNDRTLNLIKNYYYLINEFHQMYNFECKDEYYVLWRGTNVIDIKNDQVKYEIPFSTSIKKQNVFSWINYEKKCCIWKILVPINTKLLCINNPNEGKEVILPSGYLNIITKKNIKNEEEVIVYICKFEEIIL